MSISRLFALIALTIFVPFTVNAAKAPVIHGENPKFISITRTPCYTGCNYVFPYCYHYNVSNMNDGIKVEEWNVEKGFVTGRAIANLNANLIIKECYQLSLASAITVIDEKLDLVAEFEFKIKSGRHTSVKDVNDHCIDYGESSVSYSSFKLKGDLTEDPIPEMERKLIEDIKSMIKHSVCETVYYSLTGDSSHDHDKSKNIYCDKSQNDSESNTTSCPCS